VLAQREYADELVHILGLIYGDDRYWCVYDLSTGDVCYRYWTQAQAESDKKKMNKEQGRKKYGVNKVWVCSKCGKILNRIPSLHPRTTREFRCEDCQDKYPIYYFEEEF